MKRAALFVIVLLVAVAPTARAQVLTGNLIGTVKDESGAVLPGVSVALASPGLPTITGFTTEKGEYRFTLLNPGTYVLTVTLSGFSIYEEQGLQVAVGGTTERHVRLKLASVEETITVRGESPMVDPRTVGVTSHVPKEIVEELPSRRNVISGYLKWSTPGASPTDPSGYTGSVSVLGSGSGENSIIIEGANPGTAGSDLGAVEEIQVITLGASAEYQVAQGGVFNFVMKSGTNDWKYDGVYYWYPDALESKPIKLPCNCSLGETGYTKVRVLEPSGHAGGPLVKNKLFFFGGGIWSDRVEANPGVDYRLPRIQYNRANFVKATWQVNNRLKITGSNNHNWYSNPGLPTISRPFETILTGNIGHSNVYATEVNFITSNTLIAVRATGMDMPKRSAQPISGDYVTSYHIDSLTGIACCGVQSLSNTPNGIHGQAIKVNRYVRTSRVEHDLRFGVQLSQQDTHTYGAIPSGVWYSDVGGRPDQATFRDPYSSGAASSSQGVWAEDQATFGGRVTLSVGARFDRMHAVSPDQRSATALAQPTGEETVKGLGDMFTWTAFAPRVGFNFKLTEDGKSVVRGHYGRAFREISLNEFENVHPGLSRTTLARWNAATGQYSTIVSVTSPNDNLAFDPNSEAPFTDSVSIGFDRELMAKLGVGLTYVYKYGQNQIGWKDIGGIYGTSVERLPDGRTVTVYPLLNATSARKFLRTNGPGSFTRYQGLLLTLNKRLSQRWLGNIGYTYSKAEGLTDTGQDPNDDVNNGGRLATDRPHMFVGGGQYQFPRIELQTSVQVMSLSGTPYAPQALVNLPQGRRSVNIEPAGDYRLPHVGLVYIRVAKSLFRKGDRRVELSAEIANALQDTGHSSVVSRNFYSTTFGQGSAWMEPRRLYFIAKTWF